MNLSLQKWGDFWFYDGIYVILSSFLILWQVRVGEYCMQSPNNKETSEVLTILSFSRKKAECAMIKPD